jgi:ribosomal protein L12E/L44/L45/RPP1/RPP2
MFEMTKRFWILLMAAVMATGAAACNDNAEDHTNEAAEEARSGDTEEAAEESAEAKQDSAQGDLTEGPN